MRGELSAVVLLLSLSSCKEQYRVGDFVWVEWDERDYPAYIIQERVPGRYRVHFDGYDERWDEEVTLDRIRGRIEGEVVAPPPPPRVSRAMGRPAPSSSAQATPYRTGDHVRVKWRGSVYGATVLSVEAPDRYRVHYEGHEDAWDETVPLERIVGSR